MFRLEKWQPANVDVRQGHIGISPASVEIWQLKQISYAKRATPRRWKKCQAGRNYADRSLIFPNTNRLGNRS
jgi:hypothetical protein